VRVCKGSRDFLAHAKFGDRRRRPSAHGWGHNTGLSHGPTVCLQIPADLVMGIGLDRPV